MDQLIVRVVFIVAMGSGSLMQAACRRRYQTDKRQGLLGGYEAVRRFISLPICFVGLIWLFRPSLLAFATISPPFALWMLGIVLIVGGWALWIWSQVSLGENWSPVVTLRSAHTLTRNGPYAFIRHPMYGGFILIAAGLLLAGGNWFAGLMFGLMIGMTVCRASYEERLMESVFGDEYRNYKKSSSRYLPLL